MSFSVRGLNVVRNTILTSPEGGMATPLAVAQTLDGPRPERVAPTCQVFTVSAQAVQGAALTLWSTSSIGWKASPARPSGEARRLPDPARLRRARRAQPPAVCPSGWPATLSPDQPACPGGKQAPPVRWLWHGNGRGIEGWNGLIGSHAAATTSDDCVSCLRSEDPQGRSGDQVALKVESVVCRGVHVQETLGGFGRLKR